MGLLRMQGRLGTTAKRKDFYVKRLKDGRSTSQRMVCRNLERGPSEVHYQNK